MRLSGPYCCVFIIKLTNSRQLSIYPIRLTLIPIVFEERRFPDEVLIRVHISAGHELQHLEQAVLNDGMALELKTLR